MNILCGVDVRRNRYREIEEDVVKRYAERWNSWKRGTKSERDREGDYIRKRWRNRERGGVVRKNEEVRN